MSSSAGRCVNCSGTELYRTDYPIAAVGNLGPDLLPGLGSAFNPPKIDVVVCASCGLIRLFATEEYLKQLSKSDRWERV